MHSTCLAAVAMTLAAGCSVQEPPIKEIYAEDMPVSFAYESLAGRTPQYQQITHPHTGAVAQRMMVDGSGEWAIIDYNAISGDYAYRTQDPRTIVQSMFKPGVPVVWGEQGNLHGARAVTWPRVGLTDPAASCLAMVRSVREHVEGGIGSGVQAFAAGLYCRAGEGSIPAEEIPRIASALQVRA
jgi:hypothetical protein